MNKHLKFEDRVIAEQISEINSAIGNQQLTLAAEQLIDFIISFGHPSDEFSRLRGEAVKLKRRVVRLQRGMQHNLPLAEDYETVEAAMLTLLNDAETNSSLPQEIVNDPSILKFAEQIIYDREEETELNNNPIDAAEMRAAIIKSINKTRDNENGIVRINAATTSYNQGEFTLGPVSVNLVPGEITGVVGMNSSGKTTLLRLAVGELKPDTGVVDYPSLVHKPRSRSKLSQYIGYVRQIPELWTGYLRLNLNYTCSASGLFGRENQEFVDLLVNRYGLEDHQHKNWNEISGGFKTRFELVRTLLSRPDVLILDEPLAYLDIVAQQIFLYDLKKIAQSQKKPIPILITSQHLYEVESIADNMVILDDGKCIFSGSMSEMQKTAFDLIFEASIKATEKEILEKLNPLGLMRLEPTALGHILFFPSSSKVEDVIGSVTRAFSGKISYIRDISASTRRLFRNSRDDFAEAISISPSQ